MLWNAIPRLVSPKQPHVKGMIGFAIVGVLVNGLAAYRTKSGSSLNEQVVSWHLLEDVLGWVAVLIVSIVMYFKEIPILDPLLSIGITLYILINVYSNFKKTILLFLQTVPEDIDIEDIVNKFHSIDNVISTHHNHIWSLDSEHHVLSTHIKVPNDLTLEEITEVKKQARDSLDNLGIEHTTIEIELESESVPR